MEYLAFYLGGVIMWFASIIAINKLYPDLTDKWVLDHPGAYAVGVAWPIVLFVVLPICGVAWLVSLAIVRVVKFVERHK